LSSLVLSCIREMCCLKLWMSPMCLALARDSCFVCWLSAAKDAPAAALASLRRRLYYLWRSFSERMVTFSDGSLNTSLRRYLGGEGEVRGGKR
jgi:hypothetical protein